MYINAMLPWSSSTMLRPSSQMAASLPSAVGVNDTYTAAFVDRTAGYDSECAVLFPESVSVAVRPEVNHFGGIFCDREAERFRRVVGAAADVVGLNLPPDAAALLRSERLSLTVTTAQGTIQLPYLLVTGTPGATTVVLQENFEGVIPPALPAPPP